MRDFRSIVGNREHTLTMRLAGSLPASVEAGLAETLKGASASALAPQRIVELHRSVHSGAVPDYSRDWAAFSFLYYGANFAKAYLAARHLDLGRCCRPLRILDLGCGGGASTVGALAALSDSQWHTGRVASITGVDRSAEQLAVFDKSASPWIRTCFPSAVLDLRREDIFQFLRRHDSDLDLAIVSYVTPELSASDNVHLRELLRRIVAAGSGEALIIDNDPLERGITVERHDGLRYLVPVDEIDLNFPILDEPGVEVQPKYAFGRDERQLLSAYFRAWENHDEDEVRRIFATDATYEIVGVQTFRGIEEIASYWREIGETQCSVNAHIIRSWIQSNSIVASWAADFERVDRREHRHLYGLLYLRLHEGRIASLVEVYRQQIFPLNRPADYE